MYAIVSFALVATTLVSHASGQTPGPSTRPATPRWPDPLVMLDGRPVRTIRQWSQERRPELAALLQTYLFGKLPPAATVTPRTLFVDEGGFGGKATLTEIRLQIGPPMSGNLHLLLAIPNGTAAPAPVILVPSAFGNHVYTDHPRVTIGDFPVRKLGLAVRPNADDARGSRTNIIPLEMIVDRGYAVAVFAVPEIAVDFFSAPGEVPWFQKADPSDVSRCGTLGAWAWGAMRAVDYLVTDSRLDSGRIAAVGHSRRGKTVLLAAAMDQRIALVIPVQSGLGGAAPIRPAAADRMADMFRLAAYWFPPMCHSYQFRLNELPVDADGLMALVAPRPILLPNAQEDVWCDAPGQFQMLRQVDRVYRFLGVEGLESDRMPEAGKLLDGRLGFHLRPGKHGMGAADWSVFLQYMDRRLKS